MGENEDSKRASWLHEAVGIGCPCGHFLQFIRPKYVIILELRFLLITCSVDWFKFLWCYNTVAHPRGRTLGRATFHFHLLTHPRWKDSCLQHLWMTLCMLVTPIIISIFSIMAIFLITIRRHQTTSVTMSTLLLLWTQRAPRSQEKGKDFPWIKDHQNYRCWDKKSITIFPKFLNDPTK